MLLSRRRPPAVSGQPGSGTLHALGGAHVGGRGARGRRAVRGAVLRELAGPHARGGRGVRKAAARRTVHVCLNVYRYKLFRESFGLNCSPEISF